MAWQAACLLYLLHGGECLTIFPSLRRSVISAAVDNKRINGDNGEIGGESLVNFVINQKEDNFADFTQGLNAETFVNGEFFPRNEVNGYVVKESGYHRFLNNGRWRELRLSRQKSIERMKSEENEDGYADMRRKRRPFWKSLLRLPISVGERILPEDRPEPGTLILVRHGESSWNANKTFTGMISSLCL